MEHSLSATYGLTADEILNLVNSRFRLKVALEGGVAEYQMEKHVSALVGTLIERYEAIDKDKIPDFKIWLPGKAEPIWAECKNTRNTNYQQKGVLTNYCLELQKTRASKADESSRYYDATHFQIVGVCLGKHTGDWSQFMFARTADLLRHKNYPHKFEVMHRVPLPNSGDYGFWSDDLATIIKKL